jgi:hypothetical protein
MDGGFPAVYAERAQYLLPRGNWEESACFLTGDGRHQLRGRLAARARGWWMTARELVELRAENATLRAAPATPVAVAVALVCRSAGRRRRRWLALVEIPMTPLVLLLLCQAPSTTIADPSVQSEKVTTTKSGYKARPRRQHHRRGQLRLELGRGHHRRRRRDGARLALWSTSSMQALR